MKRVIVDYKKLTPAILGLLVARYPDGYDDDDIISFRNARNELIEAVEVRTEEVIYLVKVSSKLVSNMEDFLDGEENESPSPTGEAQQELSDDAPV